MTHREKVAQFELILRERDFWISNAIPPIWRFLWLCGIELPPPYFLSFGANAAFTGGWFAIAYGMISWAMLWSGAMSIVVALALSVLAGVAFGVCMATFWKYQAWKLRLPPWDEFARSDGATHAF